MRPMATCYLCKRKFYKITAHARKYHPRWHKKITEAFQGMTFPGEK